MDLNGSHSAVADEIRHLRRIRADLMAEVARIDKAITILNGGYVVAQHGTRADSFPHGVFALTLRFIKEGYNGLDPITVRTVRAWIEEHGWVTDSADRNRAVSNAMSHLSRASPPQLVRWRAGRYYPPGHPSLQP